MRKTLDLPDKRVFDFPIGETLSTRPIRTRCLELEGRAHRTLVGQFRESCEQFSRTEMAEARFEGENFTTRSSNSSTSFHERRQDKVPLLLSLFLSLLLFFLSPRYGGGFCMPDVSRVKGSVCATPSLPSLRASHLCPPASPLFLRSPVV